MKPTTTNRPDWLEDREVQREWAKTPDNAAVRELVFVAFRGCSEDSRTQRDRRERLAVRFAVPSDARNATG
jgi:hypothetical protein